MSVEKANLCQLDLSSRIPHRLEAATSRLEDITVAQSQHANSTSSGSLAAPVAAAAASGGLGGAAAASSSAQQEDSPAIQAWDESVTEALKAYQDLSAKLGGVVQEQVSRSEEREVDSFLDD